MKQELKSKLIKDMPMQDYQDLPAMSKSMIAEVAKKTPLHMYRKYLDPLNKPKFDEDAERPYYTQYKEQGRKHFDFGTALHCFVLEQENMDKYVAIMPDVNLRTNAGKDEMEAFLKNLNGRATVTSDEMLSIKNAAKNVLAHPATETMLSGSGFVESTILWTDENGVEKKCRPDYMNPEMDIIVDVKTAADGDPDNFKYASRKFMYHVSHALSAEGYEAHFGRPLKAYVYLVVEKDTEDVVYYNSEEDCLAAGQQVLEEFTPIYQKCVETNNWEGYPKTILPLNMP